MVFYRSQGNKYGAKKTEFKGEIYDSKGEAGLAAEIDIRIKAGQVESVERQVRFLLFGRGGAKICTHVVDFVLTMPDGSLEVWEYKGMETRDFKIKYKLFLDNYPNIKYIIVKR